MSEVSSNKVAIITGGSRGVGAATAKLLASKGWNITITCTSSMDDANIVVKECEELGVEAIALTADVSEDNSCVKTAQETINKWGRIDALVNNAGTTKFVFNHADLDGLDADDFLHIYKVNVVGPFQMVRACKEMLLNSENPSVVNISSIAGIKGLGSSLAYASSKGALNTMTKSMARNLGPIRVNAICPGFIQGDWLRNGMGDDLYNAALENLTNNTPLKLTVTPEQVAEGIYSFIGINKVVTGETMLMDGGHHLIT
ncbi:MAG: SDR family oxidoreductase [Gammaproteobacteria bacterium]|jgi:3-oxoacyl-[acyl-carrier protein] reductase|nr:oxidoreductase [Gammaproteobacteria bacterium]RZP01506.1 MAG: SDR family oxidoreductase [Gammaproteobacteria bacterium]HAP31189.1 oxidoreductase [Flavobacteriales bacterium]|tara:strand:+ start:145 stop:918 length:774 start_codon:yes stop_codon:yes gene_type:complete